MKFSIKHRDTDSVLFEFEADSFVMAVESAVKSGANLSRANLSWANLSRANLSLANLLYANLINTKYDYTQTLPSNVSIPKYKEIEELKDQIKELERYKIYYEMEMSLRSKK